MLHQSGLNYYKKMIILVGIGLLTFCSLTPAYAQSNSKIGIVDIRKVYDNWDEKKKVDKQFDPDRKKLDEQQKTFEDAVANLNRRKMVMDAKQIEEEEKKIAEMRATLQQSFLAIRDKIDNKAEELSVKLNKLMRDAIKELVDKEGYTLVFDSRSIYYADDQYDLTNKIIQMVNNPKKPAQSE